MTALSRIARDLLFSPGFHPGSSRLPYQLPDPALIQTKNRFAPIRFDTPRQAPSQVVEQECHEAPWVAWLDEDFSNTATRGELIEYGTHSLQNKLVAFCRSGPKGSTIEVDKVALGKS